ncbi:MAG: ABC transporter permease [Anaerolineae bacterium]|nr:ABC transporter permease [Anaerolineae bacterium]
MADTTLGTASPARRSGGWRIERLPSPVWVQVLIPFLAIGLAFLITSILVLMAQANPLDAFYYLLIEPISTRNGALDVLVKATPILFTGLAVLVAFSGGYFNIGAEGQLLAGAIAAAGLGVTLQESSPWLAIPIILLAGFIAGALWALLPALLRVYLRVDEVVTTLLLNSVMALGLSGLLTGPWRDPSGWPRTPMIAEAIRLPRLAPPSRLRAGILLGIAILLILWFVLRRTAFGVKLRAVGLEPRAARFMGINVPRTVLIAALVSGGIAGLAGTTEILGIQGRLIAESSPGYGYTGVVVAMLAGLSAPGVLIAACFIALVETGSLSLSQALNVPQYLGDVVQAVTLITMLACLLLTNYRLRRQK